MGMDLLYSWYSTSLRIWVHGFIFSQAFHLLEQALIQCTKLQVIIQVRWL